MSLTSPWDSCSVPLHGAFLFPSAFHSRTRASLQGWRCCPLEATSPFLSCSLHLYAAGVQFSQELDHTFPRYTRRSRYDQGSAASPTPRCIFVLDARL